jgi:glutamate/tyrosine decarboxylase-like PLP-dependent enzyme
LRKQLEAAADNEEHERINAELNQLNERIMKVVQRSGRAYLSNAVLRGKFALRACIINFRTTRADIRITFEVVQEAARQIEAGDENR